MACAPTRLAVVAAGSWTIHNWGWQFASSETLDEASVAPSSAHSANPRLLAGCGNKVGARLISVSCQVKWGLGGRLEAFGAAVGADCGALGAESGHRQPACSSLGRRTRLQAAAVSVNIQPIRSMPRWRVLRGHPPS